MAIFEEKKPCAGRTICFILVIFALSYSFWDLGMRELFRNESEYAVAAQEMNSFPPLITLHGQMQTGIFPLFPALAKGLSACGLPMEFSLRFISVVSLLALVMIVWLACYRTGGIQASAAGAAVMLSTLLAAEKAVEGYPHMLTALILYSGWLLWFELALGRGNWNLAWIAAGLFGGLAYCNAGVTGLIYFAIPLLIQQRPLNVWTKLRYPGVPVCLGILALFILLQWLPQWEAKMAMAAPVQQEGPAVSGYFKQLIGFLPDIFFRFLPWSLMLWAPFCSALIPLDPNPLFGKFHRILFLTLGVMLWLNPETRSRDLLYLTPLLAVLIGEFYWIVVRRYGFRFLTAFRFFGWILLLASILFLGFLYLPESFLQSVLPRLHALDYRTGVSLIVATLEVLTAFCLTVTGLILCVRKQAVWKVYLLFFGSMMLLFWGVVNPYRAYNRPRSAMGREFRSFLPAEEEGKKPFTIYKDSQISGLYPECWYMGVRVKTADTSRQIADDSETVYVISTGVPAAAGRDWVRLYDTVYKDNRLFLYKGIPRKDETDEYDEDY
ncbi:MAG: hypothetical protein J5944_14155 [Lentisphaeria bacterium]|nr:hypothetical protein [Lentisphaeria bacterium]